MHCDASVISDVILWRVKLVTALNAAGIFRLKVMKFQQNQEKFPIDAEQLLTEML